MRVLVTGGNGFIGSHTVKELRDRGHEPFIFDRTNNPDFLGDLRDATAVTEAVAHADSWIHLAGVLGTQETIDNPRPAAETNILGGLNVLAAAAQYKTPGVNIAVGNYWMDNTYSISKNTVERFVAMYVKEHGLQAASVRAFNAYGPGQTPSAPYGPSKVRKIMPAFICRALSGHPIEVYGDGSQVMDMVYVTDVARTLVDTLEKTVSIGPQGTVQAGSGRSTTVSEIAHTVAAEVEQQTGITAPVVHLPMRPGEPEGAVVLADEGIPHAVTLEDGVRRTVEWFRESWRQ